MSHNRFFTRNRLSKGNVNLQSTGNSRAIFKAAPDVLFQEASGELYLLSPRKGNFYSLNSVGARAWELLCQFGDPKKVVLELLDEYDVSEERLRIELEALLRYLCAAQLLEKEDAPAS